MKKLLLSTLTLCSALALATSSMAQGSSEYGSGIKLKLNDDGSKYMRFITWHQMWTRYTQNNPGTAGVNGMPDDISFDVGLRRSRFLAFAQINKRFLILTHFGINNQTFINGGASGSAGVGGYGVGKKPQLFMHDAWVDYTVIGAKKEDGTDRNFTMRIGSGLHYFNGLSRKSMASTLNFMTLDAPIFNWQNIELTDQFARQMGWFLIGTAGKANYTFFLNKPFYADQSASITSPTRAFNLGNDNWSTGGYVEYQFFDKESTLLPFKVGSYLGTKKVLNLGAGFYHHPGSSGVLDTLKGTITPQDQTAISVDLYYDCPIGENGSAITAYGAFYNFDYGTNYFRTVGIMNTNTTIAASNMLPTSYERPIEGGGNNRVLMGSGNIIYAEAGYLLPTNVLGEKNGKLQVFGAFTMKDLDYLKDAGTYYDLGVNYYMAGHHSKLTLQYSDRCWYKTDAAGDKVIGGRKGEVILQAMIYL